MEKNIICIICPRGCQLKVTLEGENINVTGNVCKRGEAYAISECTNPLRTVTSIVRVANRTDTMVSVKTDRAIPKEKIAEVMDIIRKINVEAPVKIGDIVAENIFSANIIATKTIL